MSYKDDKPKGNGQRLNRAALITAIVAGLGGASSWLRDDRESALRVYHECHIAIEGLAKDTNKALELEHKRGHALYDEVQALNQDIKRLEVEVDGQVSVPSVLASALPSVSASPLPIVAPRLKSADEVFGE